jgi:hypothetical protein
MVACKASLNNQWSLISSKHMYNNKKQTIYNNLKYKSYESKGCPSSEFGSNVTTIA